MSRVLAPAAPGERSPLTRADGHRRQALLVLALLLAAAAIQLVLGSSTASGALDASQAVAPSSGLRFDALLKPPRPPEDTAHDAAVDAHGSAYVVGRTTSTRFPTTRGAFDETPNGSDEAFVAKLNATGTALVYSTYLGGMGQDSAAAIAVDDAGNAYVAGSTSSPNFPVTPDAFDPTRNSSWSDGYVSKLNAAGDALVYSTYLGGTDWDFAAEIAVDAKGFAYVTGHSEGADFPTTPDAYDPTFNGGLNDAFVTKLNRAGSALVYSTYLGGRYEEPYPAIAVDGQGRAYVTGGTRSPDFPTTDGAYDREHGGNNDAFVTRLDADGAALDYSTYLGGTDGESSRSIAVDPAGAAFVTGTTTSTNFPTTPGAFDTTYGGDADAFVTRLRSDGGALTYSTYLGDERSDSGIALAVDPAGHAYVTGLTHSSRFPTTPGAFDTVLDGLDAFVTKVSSTATSLVYSTYLGGRGPEYGYGIALNDGGAAHVVGSTRSGNFPATRRAFDRSLGGVQDAYVTKLRPGGDRLAYSTFLGGGK